MERKELKVGQRVWMAHYPGKDCYSVPWKKISITRWVNEDAYVINHDNDSIALAYQDSHGAITFVGFRKWEEVFETGDEARAECDRRNKKLKEWQ